MNQIRRGALSIQPRIILVRVARERLRPPIGQLEAAIGDCLTSRRS
jgi:hypothetical protein